MEIYLNPGHKHHFASRANDPILLSWNQMCLHRPFQTRKYNIPRAIIHVYSETSGWSDLMPNSHIVPWGYVWSWSPDSDRMTNELYIHVHHVRSNQQMNTWVVDLKTANLNFCLIFLFSSQIGGKSYHANVQLDTSKSRQSEMIVCMDEWHFSVDNAFESLVSEKFIWFVSFLHAKKKFPNRQDNL